MTNNEVGFWGVRLTKSSPTATWKPATFTMQEQCFTEVLTILYATAPWSTGDNVVEVLTSHRGTSLNCDFVAVEPGHTYQTLPKGGITFAEEATFRLKDGGDISLCGQLVPRLMPANCSCSKS